MTGWQSVHRVMAKAGLSGPHASPKELRHRFGAAAGFAGIYPQPRAEMTWPYAQLSATTVYADTVGAEEQDTARRM